LQALGLLFSMPKSKRNKLVTLSKTKKKGKVQKESLVKSVRDCLDEYSSVYVFSFENMRNTKFKEFKEDLKSSSRFFLGSNKVLQIALGRTAADELKEDLHKVTEV
jgi:mRNA turnover protein 4